MGSFTDFLEDEVLDHVFGAAAYTAPVTLWVGLSTTTITDAGGNITQPVGGSYSRVSVTNNATNFPASSGGAKSNGTAITFAIATGSWGTCTDFFIADSDTGGSNNILGYGVLTVAKTISSGDIASFAIGDLDLSLT